MQSDNYQAIARRFRPKIFQEVTGQEVIVTTLKNAIRKKKVSHAYLFSGIRGTGKTTLARLFAKALNCENLSSDIEPCNNCSSCREITSGQSLDVLEIDGASNRGIDDIRNLNETLGYATFKNRYKVFIIDEVHMLTKEAFNALLKSLEEPPSNVKFFLATTEPQKLPPTITSRCQRFDLMRISPAATVQKLHYIAKECEVEIEPDALNLITRLSEGSLRDAESLLDRLICLGQKTITVNTLIESLGFVSKEALFELDSAYAKGDVAFSFSFAEKLFVSGKDITFFIDLLFEHYRTITLLLLGKTHIDNFGAAERAGYSKALQIYELHKVLFILEHLSKLTLDQPKISFKRLHLETILLYIIQSKSRMTIEEIVSDLNKLKTTPTLVAAPHLTTPLPPTASQMATTSLPLTASPIATASAPLVASPPVNSPSPEIAPPKCETPIPTPPPVPPTYNASVRHETLLRFAAVELNGTIKKTL